MNHHPRPATSKPRGVCRYYKDPRGCYAGDACKFLHAEPGQLSDGSKPSITPYDQAKRCKFYAKGFCKRGDKCWFSHICDSGFGDGSREECSICFERPVTYGLLSGCSHVFCIECIRRWRDPKKGGDVVHSGANKTCPMCRTGSRFITPSSKFWKEGEEGKERIVRAYKESMARVPCKHFQESKTKNPLGKPACPFGKECFYQHLNDDGSNYVFSNGISQSMHPHSNPGFTIQFPFNLEFGRSTASALSREMDILDFDSTIFDRLTLRSGDRDTQPRIMPGGNGGGDEDGRHRLGREVVGDEEILDRARYEIVTEALMAIRAELDRFEQPRELGPRVIPETLLPGAWSLGGTPGENIDVRLGQGWTDLFPGMGLSVDVEQRDAVIVERLEILAEHMVASLQFMGERRRFEDDELADRYGTPSLPSIRDLPLLPENHDELDTSRSGGMNDPDKMDDLPALESISNASENDDDDDEVVEGSETMIRPVRDFDLACSSNESQDASHRPLPSPWSLFRLWGDSRQEVNTSEVERNHGGLGNPQTDDNIVTSTSGRFSTVVQRELISRISEGPGPEHVENSSGGSDGSDQLSSQMPVPQSPEPVFMTDGRGRVVWSNTEVSKPQPVTDRYPSATPPNSGSSNFWARDPSASDLFITSVGVEAIQEPQSPSDSPRSLFGRMFGALF